MKLSVIRYIKIYWRLARLSVMSQMEYRFSFFTEALASAFDLILYLTFIDIIFANSQSGGGYGRYEVMLIYGLSIIARSLVNRLFLVNLRDIAILVNQGEIDHLLTKPINTLFLITTKRFAIFALFDTTLGIILTHIALSNLGITLDLAQLATVAICLVATATTFFFIILSLMSTSFWLGDINHGYWIYTALHGISRLPVSVFQGVSRFLFYNLLPFVLFGAVPAAIILQRIEPSQLWVFLVVVIFWIVFGRSVWRLGLKSYSSSGG